MPLFVAYAGADPLAFVVSLNLRRRHLSESQRAMVAARIATMGRGRPTENPSIEGFPPTADQASKMLNVGRASIERARTVQSQGAPELVAAVETGRVSVSAAADIATLPQPQQAEIVARGEKEILQAAKEIRAQKAIEQRDKRIEKIAEIAQGRGKIAT